MTRIESRRLREIAAHWDEVRSGRLMPGWSHIDPVAIARHLPIVWSWKYDRAADRFTGRLAGEEINNAFGRSLRGADMAEFFRDADFDGIFARHRRVARGVCLAHGHGQVFSHARRVGIGERIILPLAEDGTNGDGIFGATVYRLAPPGRGAVANDVGETVTFYPIGGEILDIGAA
ncbi:MAG: PAS domain-containing protein [Alphaproteobacteria bacterium]|nr:PAS domain-containing protein [Alphaproteobacteria bacterium]